MKNKIMEIVRKMCGTQPDSCKSLNKVDLAKELLTIANVPENAEIQEIPLDWDNQIVVLFLLPNDNNYYSLFAGIGNSGDFHFDLTITGCINVNGEEFDFFDIEKNIDIDYFLTVNKTESEKNENEKAKNILEANADYSKSDIDFLMENNAFFPTKKDLNARITEEAETMGVSFDECKEIYKNDIVKTSGGYVLKMYC